MAGQPTWKSELEHLAAGYLLSGTRIFAIISFLMAAMAWYLGIAAQDSFFWLNVATGLLLTSITAFRKWLRDNTEFAGFLIVTLIVIRDALFLSNSTTGSIGFLSLACAADLAGVSLIFLWPLATALAYLTMVVIVHASCFMISGNMPLVNFMSGGGILVLSVAAFSTILMVIRFRTVRNMIEGKLDLVRNNEWMSTQNRIIEEKSAELQLSNNRLKEFAYMVSHDLKAPLRGVRNLAAWIREDFGPQLPEGVNTHLELMDRQIQKMEAMIRDVLDYAREQAGNRKQEWIRLDDLVRDIIELVDSDKSTQFTMESSIPEIHGSRIVISQVLQNLLTNSIKHNDKSKKEVSIRISGDAESVSFTVSDNGPGIDPLAHLEIFNLFHTLGDQSDGENTGIGLPVARKMVEEAGGRLWLESEPGKGSQFHFVLPRQG
jgi:signal transduction histidine kinase